MKKLISFRNAILASFFVFVSISFILSAIVYFIFKKDQEVRNVEATMKRIKQTNLLIYKAQQDFMSNELINPKFYKLRKSKYLQIFEYQINVCRTNIQKLKRLRELQANYSSILQIEHLVENQNSLFHQLVDYQLQRGYKDFGVEGKMRENIHSLENEFPTLNRVKILSLRKAEKDYLLRKDKTYITQFKDLKKSLIDDISELPTSKRKEATQLCFEYAENFLRLTELESTIGIDNYSGLKGMLSADFNNLEILTDKVSLELETQIMSYKEKLFQYLFTSLAFGIILSIILAFVLSKIITSPLERLTNHITEASKENIAINKRVKINSKLLEVRLLENQFYDMMHDISQKISEIKQNNQKLEQYNAELEAINDLLSETNIKLRKSENSLKKSITIKEKFLAIISHDVRSPLTTLKGYLNLLSSAPEMISEEKKAKTIESIKSTVDLQLNLLSNMVEWARSQMGEIKFSPEIISLYEVSYSNIKLFNPMAYNKNIIIKSEISDAAVLADRNMLELIFRNLLSNAIKFSYPNSVICIFSEKLDIHTIKIVVRDTGVGISAKNLKSILKTNNFTTSEGTENEKGTGFGLLFCKEFVERNGGEIHIESQEDKGTTVSFTLKRMLQPKMNFKKLIFASNHHYHSSY